MSDPGQPIMIHLTTPRKRRELLKRPSCVAEDFGKQLLRPMNAGVQFAE